MLAKQIQAVFGGDVFNDSLQLTERITAAEAKKMRIAAAELMGKSQLKEKRATIKAMPRDTQILLCRWLADRDFASKCISR